MGKFQHGEKHPRWKGGKSLNAHGYVVLSAGPNRKEYEHRLKIKELYRIFPGGELSIKMEVEHMDKNRAHNCIGQLDPEALERGEIRILHIGNLLVLDERIHHATSTGWAGSIRKDSHGAYMRRKNGKSKAAKATS